MKIGERLYVSLGMAASAWGDHRAEFGRAWFYWKPHLRWNGGPPFSQRVCSLGASWLCWYCDVSLWPTWVYKINDQSASTSRTN